MSIINLFNEVHIKQVNGWISHAELKCSVRIPCMPLLTTQLAVFYCVQVAVSYTNNSDLLFRICLSYHLWRHLCSLSNVISQINRICNLYQYIVNLMIKDVFDAAFIHAGQNTSLF